MHNGNMCAPVECARATGEEQNRRCWRPGDAHRVRVPGKRTSLPIDWDEAEMTAAVVIAESGFVDDRDWTDYVRGVSRGARTRGSSAGFFPVTMDSRGTEFGFEEQALR